MCSGIHIIYNARDECTIIHDFIILLLLYTLCKCTYKMVIWLLFCLKTRPPQVLKMHTGNALISRIFHVHNVHPPRRPTRAPLSRPYHFPSPSQYPFPHHCNVLSYFVFFFFYVTYTNTFIVYDIKKSAYFSFERFIDKNQFRRNDF